MHLRPNLVPYFQPRVIVLYRALLKTLALA